MATSTLIQETAKKHLMFLPNGISFNLDQLSDYIRNVMGKSKSEWNQRYGKNGHLLGRNNVQHALRTLKFEDSVKDSGQVGFYFDNPVRGYWIRKNDQI